MQEEEEEDHTNGISVYKSNVGPSLTVQPRRKTYSEISMQATTRTHTRSLKKRPLVTEKIKLQQQPSQGEYSTMSRKLQDTFANLTLTNEQGNASAGELSDITRVVSHNEKGNSNIMKPRVKNVRNNFMTRRYGVVSRSGFQKGRQPPLKTNGVPKGQGNIAQRVASAKRLNISDMKNHIKYLQLRIEVRFRKLLLLPTGFYTQLAC